MRRKRKGLHMVVHSSADIICSHLDTCIYTYIPGADLGILVGRGGGDLENSESITATLGYLQGHLYSPNLTICNTFAPDFTINCFTVLLAVFEWLCLSSQTARHNFPGQPGGGGKPAYPPPSGSATVYCSCSEHGSNSYHHVLQRSRPTGIDSRAHNKPNKAKAKHIVRHKLEHWEKASRPCCIKSTTQSRTGNYGRRRSTHEHQETFSPLVSSIHGKSYSSSCCAEVENLYLSITLLTLFVTAVKKNNLTLSSAAALSKLFPCLVLS